MARIPCGSSATTNDKTTAISMIVVRWWSLSRLALFACSSPLCRRFAYNGNKCVLHQQLDRCNQILFLNTFAENKISEFLKIHNVLCTALPTMHYFSLLSIASHHFIERT